LVLAKMDPTMVPACISKFHGGRTSGNGGGCPIPLWRRRDCAPCWLCISPAASRLHLVSVRDQARVGIFLTWAMS
jgi:hypothetical protein